MRWLLQRHPLLFCLALVALIGAVVAGAVLPRFDAVAIETTEVRDGDPLPGYVTIEGRLRYRLGGWPPAGVYVVEALAPGFTVVRLDYEQGALTSRTGVETFRLHVQTTPRPGLFVTVVATLMPAQADFGPLDAVFRGTRRDVRVVALDVPATAPAAATGPPTPPPSR